MIFCMYCGADRIVIEDAIADGFPADAICCEQ